MLYMVDVVWYIVSDVYVYTLYSKKKKKFILRREISSSRSMTLLSEDGENLLFDGLNSLFLGEKTRLILKRRK